MEGAWHKQLKREARGWLAGIGDVHIVEEVAFDSEGILLYRKTTDPYHDFQHRVYKKGHVPLVIIDVVAFRDKKPIIGVECGNVAKSFRHNRLSFPVYHLASLFRQPHLIGECSYCMNQRDYQRNFNKHAPDWAIIFEELPNEGSTNKPM